MQNIIKRHTIARLFQIKAAKLNDQLMFTVAWITNDLLRNSMLNDTNTVVVRDLVSHPRGRHMATVLTVMDVVYRVLTGDKQSPARSILSEGMIDKLESFGIDTTDTKLESVYEPSGLFIEMIDACLHSDELKSDWKEMRNLIFSKIVMSPDGPLPFSDAWFKLRDEYNRDMVQMHLVDKPFETSIFRSAVKDIHEWVNRPRALIPVWICKTVPEETWYALAIMWSKYGAKEYIDDLYRLCKIVGVSGDICEAIRYEGRR